MLRLVAEPAILDNCALLMRSSFVYGIDWPSVNASDTTLFEGEPTALMDVCREPKRMTGRMFVVFCNWDQDEDVSAIHKTVVRTARIAARL